MPLRQCLRRVPALFSVQVYPFAVLIALALISILTRAWLVLKPLLASIRGV